MLDITALATSLAAFLAPAMPYLIPPATGAAEKFGEEFGAAIVDGAKALWSKLWPKVEGKEAAQEAAADLAKTPEDAAAQIQLARQFQKLLASDETLARDLDAMWRRIEQESRDTSTGGFNIQTQIAKNLANIRGVIVKDVHVGDRQLRDGSN
jgi:hypothetical protein